MMALYESDPIMRYAIITDKLRSRVNGRERKVKEQAKLIERLEAENAKLKRRIKRLLLKENP